MKTHIYDLVEVCRIPMFRANHLRLSVLGITLLAMNDKQVIAAFDFDGTISYRDSLLPFLVYRAGIVRAFFYLLVCFPHLVGFLCGFVERQGVKERILRQFFGGLPSEEMLKMGEAFARDVLPNKIRPEALARIKWHQERGHRTLLVSASVDAYLHPWAKAMGFDDALTSRLEYNNGKVTGHLIGRNCRGPEKVKRLKERLGSFDAYEIYAYGDTRGDRELLAIADHPYYRTMGES